MPIAYIVNKGTLLREGTHEWTVRCDKVVASYDLGVVSPSHTTHFNLTTKTAWGLRETGYAYYTQNIAAGYKTGDILGFKLNLSNGTLLISVNGKEVYTHTNVIAPVHVAFSGGTGSVATILS